MSQIEQAVAQHYTTGALTERVRAALEASGIDPDAATVADLKAGDEFPHGRCSGDRQPVCATVADPCNPCSGCGMRDRGHFALYRGPL